MKKVSLAVALGLLLIFFSIYFIFSKSDVAIERRIHRILFKLPSKVEGAVCMSNYDCKMQVLPTIDCIPRDFLFTYSSKETNRQEIEQDITEYKELFKNRYPENSGKPRCLNELQPISKCLESKCSILLKTGERYP